MGRLIPRISPGDWQSVARAISRLDAKLNANSAPTFSSISLTGLTPSRLLHTSAGGALASVADLTAYIAGTVNEITVADGGSGTVTLSLAAGVSGTIDHNALLNTHNLTTDIDHSSITNTHNLTTDINHASITGGHNLTTDIDHDALTNFSADEHFLQTAITNVSTALDTGLLKVTTGTGALSVITDNSANWNTAYGWGNHASAGYAISGGAEHDSFSDFVANEHIDWTNATSNFLTTGVATIGGAGDVNQLIVKANASQTITNSLISLRNSANTEILRVHSDEYRSVFLGVECGSNNDAAGGGVGNVFLGYRAGRYNTTGQQNVCLGTIAGNANTSGDYNLAIGNSSLNANQTGLRNVGVGTGALLNMNGYNYNVAIGDNCLRNTNSAENVGIGWRAGYNQGTGAYNVFLGSEAGYGSAAYNASGCVMIGRRAGYSNSTSNRLYIENSNSASPLIYGEFDNDLVRINGTLDISQKAYVTSIGGYAIKLTNRTGAATVAGQLVKADTANDDAVVLTAAGDDECFGVFLDSGVANGAEAWVVVAGIADVAMEDNTAATRGNWVQTSDSEAGYADATNTDPVAAPVHFEEIGHCIETVAAGGAGTHILARCVLHFN